MKRMSDLNRLSGFLFLVLGLSLTFVSQSFAASKYALPGSSWKVTIYNSQSSGTLVVHCKSKDDDLGEHKLNVGDEYDWEFRENFGQSTLFWCEFQSQHGYATFEVFWPEKGTWLAQRCNYENCIWAAQDDGFYLKNIPAKKFEFLHSWNAGSS